MYLAAGIIFVSLSKIVRCCLYFVAAKALFDASRTSQVAMYMVLAPID
jgi:hypothetical protein